MSGLVAGIEVVDVGQPQQPRGLAAYLSLVDVDEELPDDIEDGQKYLAVPNRRELGLGKPLALDFAKAFLPDDVFNVHEIFDKRGAYRKFHSLLRHRGATDRWYKFEAEATERALRDWCETNGIELVE